jgi:hypothetical protein
VVLSVVVIVAATVASLLILLWRRSLPAPPSTIIGSNVVAEARGWSAATLLVAIPLAAGSLWATIRGSLRGRLVWLGSLVYFVYTYLEFAVSPPFTALYLLYVTTFACALSALVMGAASIDVAQLPGLFGDRVPRRTIATSSLLFAALLAAAWLKDIGARTFAGTFGWPVGAEAVQHVVHALDLGLQVPLGIATGVMLLRRRPAGLLLAAIMLVNWVCMGAALTGMVAFSVADSGAGPWVVGPFALLCGVGLALAAALFRSGAAPAKDAGPRPKVANVVVGLEVLLAIGALAGGAALFFSPDGTALGLPLALLEHAGFESFRLPGLILFAVNGLLPLVSALGVLRRRRWAPAGVMAVGILLVGWIAIQVALLRSFDAPLHGGYLLLGLVIAGLGYSLHHHKGGT